MVHGCSCNAGLNVRVLRCVPQTSEIATEQLQRQWAEWEQIDTLRHMLDSLVAIMEEERLPVRHLPTIEDTRPTIRTTICSLGHLRSR